MKTVTIELTQRCPNTCLHCSSISSPDCVTKLDYDILINAMRLLKGMGYTDISFSGGEPLTYTGLGDVLIEADKLGLRCRIYTCGIKDDNTPIEEWNRILSGVSCSIVFGVHSFDTSTHDYVSQNKGSLRKTLCSMSAALSYGYDVNVHIVPFSINIPTMKDTIHYLVDKGISNIRLLKAVPQGRMLDNYNYLVPSIEDETEMKEMLHTGLNKHPAVFSTVSLGHPFNYLGLSTNGSCTAGCSKIVIRYDGEVLPCEAFKGDVSNQLSMGHINNIVNVGAADNSALLSLKRRALLDSVSCPATLTYRDLYENNRRA